MYKDPFVSCSPFIHQSLRMVIGNGKGFLYYETENKIIVRLDMLARLERGPSLFVA